MRVLVTGGAGFIGSHLVDALTRRESKVVVLDNLSSGKRENISHWMGNPNFTFHLGDCLNPGEVERAISGCGTVHHLAANPEVRIGALDPRIDFEQNIVATYNILEAMRRSEEAERILFTSTSTVYGEAKLLPTPEDYAPLQPISTYGASKLACEAMVSAYCHTFGIQGVVYRFANIVGSRSRHGVIYDFIRKLKENPHELEVLGDGTQTKSYLIVDDCIEAFLFGSEHAEGRFEVFNVGSRDQVNVLEIAEVVSQEMGLKDVDLKITGGVEGGRGWLGDVKEMLLDASKLEKLGWAPRHSGLESVRKAAKVLLEELDG
jgi:UDP-glucose 4-epimerase